MDTWYEEYEIVRVHPVDPYVEIDTIYSSRNLKIIVEADVVAESHVPC